MDIGISTMAVARSTNVKGIFGILTPLVARIVCLRGLLGTLNIKLYPIEWAQKVSGSRLKAIPCNLPLRVIKFKIKVPQWGI